MRRLMLPVTVAALLALASHGLAAPPQVGIADIEDEVMCPICGTLLELSYSPQAERERAYVQGLIAEGKTKAQVKDALVTQYGKEVMALPEGSGFSLSAYLVPVIALFVAIAALVTGLMRWRRHANPPEAPPSPPRGADAERLDADLSRYDL